MCIRDRRQRRRSGILGVGDGRAADGGPGRRAVIQDVPDAVLIAFELKEQCKGGRLHSGVFHQNLGRFVQGLLEDILGKGLGDQRDLQVALVAVVGHGHIVGLSLIHI